ncbi:MAG: hypothetical protein DME59_08225 [Verrucomicrobia bacterium]|nr:MAG: hypothetical protein DME59_08225 [Verrucomicrobiota bacterium]PYL72067.1 MAG: hypothetical protein DMF26_17550 [Verrucomicrobiota bacterium]
MRGRIALQKVSQNDCIAPIFARSALECGESSRRFATNGSDGGVLILWFESVLICVHLWRKS